MSSLGIYFGVKGISLVEAKGKNILNSIQIPLSTLSDVESGEKVPEEIKLVALLKDELRKNKIEAKEASVALSGKDFFIRTFEMPILPREEMPGAVHFEAKKYIPFKIEDLVSDFELKFDKANRKNFILFVGIRKETLDKYLAILTELDIKTSLLEYSAFSVLRLLKLSGMSNKGVVGIISADFQEEDEANFMVVEDGFPLFSRDITLFTQASDLDKSKTTEPAKLLEKFKTELRVSLDYYDRKFPTKNIEKIYLISGEEHPDLGAFVKEMGLSAEFLDIRKYTGKPSSLSLSLIKGYSCALAKIIRTGLKVNLAAIKPKIKPFPEAAIRAEAVSLLAGLKIDRRIVTLGILFCAATFIVGLYLRLPLERNLKNILALRPQVATVDPNSSYEDLSAKDVEYKTKIATWDNLIKEQLYLTEPLNLIPRLLPDGIWLVDFSFRDTPGKRMLELKGIAYLGDNNKEMELVNNFLSSLKQEPNFNKSFKEINIVSLETGDFEQEQVVKFTIAAANYYKRKE